MAAQKIAYVIRWENMLTGTKGSGQPQPNFQIADSWKNEMNWKYPNINHWIETVKA